MALKLMYITNRPEIARIVEEAGVDRVFVDMEYIGKSDRQGGMDTVQSHHTVEDVKAVRDVLTKGELLVRINPVHDRGEGYGSTEEEVEAVIAAGADIIMLPYFKTGDEVRRFLAAVKGRAKAMLLLETPEAAEGAEEILSVPGIDLVHIGLNDLSLGYGMKFMFQLLADGTVERLCRVCARRGISYGFGGIAGLGKGAVPAERVIREHYRLGSGCAILSRSFCNTEKVTDTEEVRRIFVSGVKEIRALEEECLRGDEAYFEENRRALVRAVEEALR